MSMGDRQSGTVKWFNYQKGFGFIAPDAGGEDLFVHQTSIRSDGFRTLAEGDAVEFYVDQGNDGRTRAVDVTGPNGAAVNSRGGGFGGGGGGFGGGGGRFGNYGGGGGGGGGGGCYNCGEMGHLARDCRQAGRGARFGNYGGGGGSSGRGCFNCGEPGHFARDCPDNMKLRYQNCNINPNKIVVEAYVREVWKSERCGNKC